LCGKSGLRELLGVIRGFPPRKCPWLTGGVGKISEKGLWIVDKAREIPGGVSHLREVFSKGPK